MKPNSLLFLVRECFLSIRRNGLMSLAALGTVTVALTVLGASLWTAYRVVEVAQQQPQRFNEIDVFLNVETERTQSLAVMERIRLLPDVSTVHLVTKESAWNYLQTANPSLTTALPDNPLMDKIEVEAKQVSHVDRLAAALRDTAQFPEAMQVNDGGQEVRKMLGFARLMRVIGGGAAIGLFVSTLFIIQNTIRLTVFARRREIRIMQLVGATPGFIRFPMMLEGLFYGVFGALIASGIILLAAREVSKFVADIHSPLLGDVPSRLTAPDMISGLIAIGALLGLLGSMLAMRRFLRQI